MEAEINNHLKNLQVYIPGKPIEELAREYSLDVKKIIKLASNENPLGTSPKALEAIKSFINTNQCVNLYPDGSAFHLKKSLAEFYSLSTDNFSIGAGSNEIIELIIKALAFSKNSISGKPDEIISSKHGFAIYRITGKMLGVKVREVEENNFHHDLDGFLNEINANTKIIFIANPNNPTGTYINFSRIKEFISKVPKNITIVLDEAYFEFNYDGDDYHKIINECKNLIILRTFSKIHGLAGLRVGYSIACREMTDFIEKVRQPFNVNSLALCAAKSALTDHDFIEQSRDENVKNMMFLKNKLKILGIEFIPSFGNFLSINVREKGGGVIVYDKLLRKGVITRPIAGHYLPDWLRVSIGTQEELNVFIKTINEI